jgi:predicted ester cyclase
VPIGAQLGKVTKIAGQAVRFAVNPQYNLIDNPALEKWKVLCTVALLVPSR